jgi:hypothetical protein
VLPTIEFRPLAPTGRFKKKEPDDWQISVSQGAPLKGVTAGVGVGSSGAGDTAGG